MKWTALLGIALWPAACLPGDRGLPPTARAQTAATDSIPAQIIPNGRTVETRFPVPAGFVRQPTDSTTFAGFLRRLPLHPAGYPVHLFNGEMKYRQDVHAAVLDLDVGRSDLQQCADAVMRLRAEYLFHQKRYSDIHFRLTNGFEAEYARWRRGERVRVDGNRTNWVPGGPVGDRYADFRKYLDLVFMYAGTASLEKELVPVELNTLQAGDVWIKGGHPGHAVLVIDVAEHPDSGERLFLLAQSYMPAQEIHVLFRRDSDKPWYSTHDIGAGLETPEWIFEKKQLRRFPGER